MENHNIETTANELATSQTQNVVLSSNQVDLASLIEASKKLDKLKPVVTLTSEYLEFQKVGDSFRGFYLGMGSVNVTDKNTGEMKTLESVRLMNNGKCYINSGVVLVDEIKKSGITAGTPIEITFASKVGNTKIYEIALIG